MRLPMSRPALLLILQLLSRRLQIRPWLTGSWRRTAEPVIAHHDQRPTDEAKLSIPQCAAEF